MRILQINSVCGIRSTGRIATDLAEKYISDGHECKVAYGRGKKLKKYENIAYRIGSPISVIYNVIKARVFDNEGFNAKLATKRFLKWADEFNPDLLCIHNLHGYYINIELLFDWIKSRPNMEVCWTLHDCWAFTGHCAHFSYVRCNNWVESCRECCQTQQYPKSLFRDASAKNYLRKKNAFSNVKKMTIISPSNWLASLVKQSFFREYPVKTVHHTVNGSVFHPNPSNYRTKMNLDDRKIVLGVATSWNQRKGLEDFVKLSGILDDQYVIVLVGITKRQSRRLPKNIICIPGTDSVQELAEIYTAADFFVNPSKEETFGLTTLEALSCGTPAIVYENTACEEVAKMYGGIVVKQDYHAIYEAINKYYEN